MTVFKVMDGEFGTDGLISSHPVTDAFATSDEAFRHIVDQSFNGSIWVRQSAPGWWVEEHHSADKRSPVMVQHPYPQTAMPVVPNWFKTEMAAWKTPSKEEIAEAMAKALEAARQSGAAAARERATREAAQA